MGTMTRDEIQAEVFRNLNDRGDVTDSDIVRWINHTYSHMTHPSVHMYEDLATTHDLVLIAGTGSYSIATAILGYRALAIRSVTYLDSTVAAFDPTQTRVQRIKPWPIERFDSTIHSLTSFGPTNYTVGEAQTILFHGTPNNTNTVRLRLWREAEKLDTGTSTTVLPEYFDEVLVMGSQALLEYKLGMRDKANQTFQLYNSYINQAANKDILEADNWGIETSLSGSPMMGIS